MPTHNFLKKLYQYALVSLGAFLNAFSLHAFVNPLKLIPGGFSGIASVLYYFVPSVSMSLIYVIINIPLLVCAIIFIKGDYTLKTIWSTLFCSLCLAILPAELVFVDAPLISVLFGGMLIGISMYVGYIANGGNGGTEVIAKIVSIKRPEKDPSSIILICNMAIMSIGTIMLVFVQKQSLMIAVYSVIYVLLGTNIMAMLNRGFNHPQKFYIITKHHKEMSKDLVKKLRRGLNCIDTFDIDGNIREQKSIVLVCQYRQSSLVKKIIKQHDSQAFVFVKDVSYVFSRPDFHRSYNYDK